jgi:hypothetical protein
MSRRRTPAVRFLLDAPADPHEFVRRFPVTLEPAVLTILVSLVIGVLVGIVSAVRQDTVSDYVGRILFRPRCTSAARCWVTRSATCSIPGSRAAERVSRTRDT